MAGVSITTTDLPASAQAFYYPDGNFSSSSLSSKTVDARPESSELPSMDFLNYYSSLPPEFPTRGESLATKRATNHDRSNSNSPTPTGITELEASPVRHTLTPDLAPRIPSGILELNWTPRFGQTSSSTAPSTHGLDDFTFDDQQDSASSHTGKSLSIDSYAALVPNGVEEKQPPPVPAKAQIGIPTQTSPTTNFPLPPPRKKSIVAPPTSRFNRKPVGSVSSISKPQPDPYPTPSLEDAPPPTPVLTLLPRTTYSPSPSQVSQTLTTPPLPPTPTFYTSPSIHQTPSIPPTPVLNHVPVDTSRQLEPRSTLKASKSTVSERRRRALNSHPDVVVTSRPNSSSDDAELLPRPSTVRRGSRKSTDSRATTPRSTIYDGQMPSPAPTAPLPELPAHARRPSAKDGTMAKRQTTLVEAPLPSPRGPLAPLPPLPSPGLSRRPMETEHVEMAEFMTNNNTVVFRRFDDVHVKLLLYLQDEISQHEADLLRLESRDSTSPESHQQRMRILRELRKTVAEYDQMFASWSQMQANKANDGVVRALKSWLETPGTSAAQGLGKGAKEDLEWLSKSNDLSSITLSQPDRPPTRSGSLPQPPNGNRSGSTPGGAPTTSRAGSGGGGGGGSWASLFACTSRRK